MVHVVLTLTPQPKHKLIETILERGSLERLKFQEGGCIRQGVIGMSTRRDA